MQASKVRGYGRPCTQILYSITKYGEHARTYAIRASGPIQIRASSSLELSPREAADQSERTRKVSLRSWTSPVQVLMSSSTLVSRTGGHGSRHFEARESKFEEDINTGTGEFHERKEKLCRQGRLRDDRLHAGPAAPSTIVHLGT